MKIVVWFSCGAASAAAAKLTLDEFGAEHDVRIANNPVAEEDADNRRFLAEVQCWLGREIEIAKNQKYPTCSAVDVWDREKFMSGPHGAPCTGELKKQARLRWQEANKPDFHVFGFTAEERHRHNWFVQSELPNVMPILIERGLTKAGCAAMVLRAGIRLPRVYEMGYPNANCIGCVKATSPTYWNHVRTFHPEVFEQRAEQSRRLGAKLVRVKGKRIFLDELDPKEKGRPMKSLDLDCGIFCGEQMPDKYAA
jgi:hypothetical protein